MAKPNEPRGRFAPIPIETTYESFRQSPKKQPTKRRSTATSNAARGSGSSAARVGPDPVPTPDASPRSQSPATGHGAGTGGGAGGLHKLQQQAPPPQRRRFAPQLIETSRRARRAGDPGPATKPTDKTDITPYTKNIYTASKPKGRGAGREAEGWVRPKPMRRETDEEAVQEYLLELAAKEAERQIQEAALAAFPNSRAREGGVTHFYFRESSGSEESPDAVSPAAGADDDGSAGHLLYARREPRTRRKSSSLGLSWWHKHMQEHAQQLARDRGEVVLDGEMAVDQPDEAKPKEDETVAAPSKQPQDQDISMPTDAELDSMDLYSPPDPLWTTSRRPSGHDDDRQGRSRDREDDRTMGPPPPQSKDESMTDASPVAKAPELPFPTSSFKTPAPPPPSAGPGAPPLGFGRPFGPFGMKPDSAQAQRLRNMASPPMLGKDLTFRRCPSPKATKLEPNHPFVYAQDDSRYRDVSGNGGLWHGYCYRTPSGRETTVTPAGIVTAEPGTTDRSAGMKDPAQAEMEDEDMAEEPDHEDRQRRWEEERNAKIVAEFDDAFVTQIYNYLSLGYPATACIFDEELSKVSHVSVAELRSRDNDDGGHAAARGHIMLEMKLDDGAQHRACPRWRALKVYVTEWARQHPNLDDLDPLAWGVREKKGSWAF